MYVNELIQDRIGTFEDGRIVKDRRTLHFYMTSLAAVLVLNSNYQH